MFDGKQWPCAKISYRVPVVCIPFTKTAFFEVPLGAPHGTELICSHEACRNGGIKFVLCAYCDIPVSKRSFKSKHSHVGEELPTHASSAPRETVQGDSPRNVAVTKKRPYEDSSSSSNGSDTASDNPAQSQAPAKKRKGGASSTHTNNEASTFAAAAAQGLFPSAASAGRHRSSSHDARRANGSVSAGSKPQHNVTSGSSDTSSSASVSDDRVSSSGGDSESDQQKAETTTQDQVARAEISNNDLLQNLHRQWIALLEERMNVSSDSDMATWMVKVLSVSSTLSQMTKQAANSSNLHQT